MSRKNRRRATNLYPTRHTDFESTAYLNDKTYIDTYNRMKEICLNLFHYENLPDSMDERYLELMLFDIGFCFLFRDDELGKFLNLAGTLDRGYDVYGNYTAYTAISFDGTFRYSLTDKDSVIMYNNYTRVPTCQQIELFAWRAWNCLRTIDTNVSQQKTTKLLSTTNQRRLTAENILMKIKGNETYALVTDDLDMSSPVIDLTVPYVADKIRIEYEKIWNDFLTFVGIVNSNTDKKERQTTIEVMGRMGDVEMERNTSYRSRFLGIQRFNKMFGTDIEVAFNSELASFLLDNRIETGWLQDGNLYDNGTEDSGISGERGNNDL